MTRRPKVATLPRGYQLEVLADAMLAARVQLQSFVRTCEVVAEEVASPHAKALLLAEKKGAERTLAMFVYDEVSE